MFIKYSRFSVACLDHWSRQQYKNPVIGNYLKEIQSMRR